MDRQAINKSQSKAINSKKLLYDTQYGIGLIEVHQWCGRTKLVIPLIGIPSWFVHNGIYYIIGHSCQLFIMIIVNLNLCIWLM